MTLGFSSKAVRLLLFRSSARVWAELHEQAFRRLGGSVRVVTLRQSAEGVLTPDITSPRSIDSTVICWATMAPWRCPAALTIRIVKAQLKPDGRCQEKDTT